jgi:MFS family permease
MTACAKNWGRESADRLIATQRCPHMTSPSLTPDTGAAAAATPPDGSAAVRTWTNPKRGFLFFLGFAAIGSGMGQLVPAVETAALKSTQIVGAAHSAGILSLTIAISALFALVATPLFGRISDRLRGRLGRRRPLIIIGAVLFAIGGILLAAAGSVLLLVLSGIFTFVGAAAVMVAVTSIIPDQFEPLKRGPASAIVGVSLPVGAVIGLGIATAVSSSLTLQILIPAGIAVLGSVVFAIVLKDPQVADAPRPPFDVVQFFSTFWVNPAKNPNFAWAWFSRLLIFFGVAAIQAYQIYYLLAVLHVNGKDVSQDLFLSTLVLTVGALIFAAIAGKISDIVKRRKPFVIVSAVIFAVGLYVASTSTTFGGFLVAIGIVGIGQGVYFAVDLALASQLVPDKENPGQGMSIMGLASTLPSSFVPALAPAVLLIGASAANPQNYAALFIAGAIAGLVGAVLILFIRGVK